MSGTQTEAAIHAEIERLRAELVLVQLCVHAAVAATPLIDDVVEDRTDRVLVVADIVSNWLNLPAQERDRYRAGRSEYDGLDEFCGDYVDTVDRGSYTGTDPQSVGDHTAEQLVYRHWRAHVRRLAGQ